MGLVFKIFFGVPGTNEPDRCLTVVFDQKSGQGNVKGSVRENTLEADDDL